jgi:hypothetical protein
LTGVVEQTVLGLMERYPIVPGAELQAFCVPLFQEIPPEDFESRVVELVSLTNRTTIGETILHLTVQKMKSLLFSES